MREALRAYLEGAGSPRPRSLGLGADAELSGRESETWLERQWSRR